MTSWGRKCARLLLGKPLHNLPGRRKIERVSTAEYAHQVSTQARSSQGRARPGCLPRYPVRAAGAAIRGAVGPARAVLAAWPGVWTGRSGMRCGLVASVEELLPVPG